MSIRRPIERYLVNNLVAANPAVTVASGVISFPGIPGMPDVRAADVVSCYRSCALPCVPQKVRVTPTVPTTPCDCPWTWEIQVAMRQCGDMRTDHVYPRSDVYGYTDPSGAVPTVSAICENIAAAINGNAYSQVKVTLVGGPGAYTAFDVEEKDCSGNGDYYSCGFTVAFTQGTQTLTTAAVPAVLPYEEMKRLWAELPGYFFGDQPAPIPGMTYCMYYMKVNTGQTPGPHLANELTDRYVEYAFYVANDGTNFATAWQTPISGALACFVQDSSSDS